MICAKELQEFFLFFSFSICWEPPFFLSSSCGPSSRLRVRPAAASGAPSASAPAMPALGRLGICALVLHPNVSSSLAVSLALCRMGSQLEQRCLHVRM